jgi:hypothetical protein
MNPDPLVLALQQITETRRLLEALITSSESFDYQKAKLTLRELNRKVRDLGKLEKRLQAKAPLPDSKIHVLDFGNAAAPAQL